MQADVIDYDELYTGKRREAQYNGLWSVMTKFTVIPSMAVPLSVLASYGYVPNAPQTETVQFVIVTHNKITMEMAHQMSGVTMSEPGVSRLVQVDVEEAAKLAGS